jgi:hypothetical protein
VSDDVLKELERQAVEEIVAYRSESGRVRVLVSAFSENGRAAAVLMLTPDDVEEVAFARKKDEWDWICAGGGGGISWTSWSPEDETPGGDAVPLVGVLCISGDAPDDAAAVIVEFDGREVEAPVRNGWYMAVFTGVPAGDDDEDLAFQATVRVTRYRTAHGEEHELPVDPRLAEALKIPRPSHGIEPDSFRDPAARGEISKLPNTPVSSSDNEEEDLGEVP